MIKKLLPAAFPLMFQADRMINHPTGMRRAFREIALQNL
jgi:hypothetical protein